MAAEAQRVALVRPPDGDAVLVEAFNRLAAELRLQDFEVAFVDNAQWRAPETLETIARRADALATAVFVRHDGRTAVDVWLEDRTSGRPVARRLETVGGTELPNVLAIRAVDLLRVGLRESTAPPPVVARIERPTIPDRASPPPLPAPKPWEIRAEGIALFDSPALGGAFGGALGLARYVAPALRVGILVSGPIVGASWETSEGSAFLRQHIGFAEARLSVWRSQAVDLGASVCAGAHYLTAQGAARPPLLSQKDQVWSAAGALGADGSFRLTSNAGLALTVRAIGLTPRAGVGVGANTTVLQLPLLSASAGFLVGF